MINVEMDKNHQIDSNRFDSFVETFDELYSFTSTTMPPAPDVILQTFDELKDDQYLKQDWPFRKRSYARGILTENEVMWHNGTDFYQPTSLNDYVGNIERVFEPTCIEMKEFIEFLMVSHFSSLIKGHSYNIGLHQIRTLTDDHHEGFPVPEGFHQDGFDYVMMLAFQNHNAEGGRSFLRKDSKEGPCIFENDMNANDVLIFHDRRLFHYASPIKPKVSGIGYRDRVVLTFETITN